MSSGSYGSSSLAGGVSACPAGSSKQADGTCLSSEVTSYESSSSSYSAPATMSGSSHQSSHHSGGHSMSQSEYCYAGSSKRYDAQGRKIKGAHGTTCKH